MIILEMSTCYVTLDFRIFWKTSDEPWVAELQHCCFYLINSSDECRKAQPYDFTTNQTLSATVLVSALVLVSNGWTESCCPLSCRKAVAQHRVPAWHGLHTALPPGLSLTPQLQLLLFGVLFPLVLLWSVNLTECSSLSLQPHPSKHLALNRTLWKKQKKLSFSFRKTCKRTATVSAPFFSVFASLFVSLCLIRWSEWSCWLPSFFFCFLSQSSHISRWCRDHHQKLHLAKTDTAHAVSVVWRLVQKKLSSEMSSTQKSKVHVARFRAECSSWWSPQLRNCICRKSAWVPDQSQKPECKNT